jgi:hypothetical protein
MKGTISKSGPQGLGQDRGVAVSVDATPMDAAVRGLGVVFDVRLHPPGGGLPGPRYRAPDAGGDPPGFDFWVLALTTRDSRNHLFAALVARPVENLGHRLRWSA